MTARTDTFDRICTRVHELAQDHRELQPADTDLTKCAPDFRLAVQRLMDARPGLPGAANYDGTPGGTSELTGPERLASQKDRTAGDRALLDRLLRQLAADCGHGVDAQPAKAKPRIVRTAWQLRRLVMAWTPRNPSDKQRRTVEAANLLPDGRTYCAVTHEALSIKVPSYRLTDLAGLLPWPQPVSRWVYDQAGRMRRLPTPTELRRWASTDDEARRMLGDLGRANAKKAQPARSAAGTRIASGDVLSNP